MTGAEIQSTYFSPLMYGLYLAIILFVAVLYYQWTWSKKVREQVKVIVVKADGDTDTVYAPKVGSSVTITNPNSKSVRTWPIDKVCFIEELYPGDGFIPKFLQKKIKTVIVDEVDWEPLLNRGAYSENVASPDVVAKLRELASAHPALSVALLGLAGNLHIAPTRKMIASPAMFGNLINEKITEAVLTVNKETFEKLDAILNRLGKAINPTIVYILIGLTLILSVVGVFFTKSQSGEISKIGSQMEEVKKALGITTTVITTPEAK